MLGAVQAGMLGAGGAAWSPANLFAAGEQGIWLDPSDFSTMFQDSAGTTPVTAVDQYVGKILDKSGRGNHATQSNNSYRPQLKQDAGGRYYLSFNGSNQWLKTAAVNFSAANKMSIISGVRKTGDDTKLCPVVYLGSSQSGYIMLLAPDNDGASPYNNYGVFGKLSSLFGGWTNRDYAPPITNVVTANLDLAQTTVTNKYSMRVNGSAVALNAYGTDTGTGYFANDIVRFGVWTSEGSYWYNGWVYSLIMRGAATSAADISSAETWVNSKTGAY